ncbi:TetR/AcrR family transcriptional regulator [Streptomyces sp. NPDC090025]|uniref:TetR/AcrR family transcriptional regulator n=1 Tax=Streptomyces sp. NPDC090025 TaxID=3365922 RepID=UPI0038339EF0
MVGTGVDGEGAAGRRIRGLDADERRARRRTDLLDAALELFATQGYQDTSIEQVCKRAFVGTKSFYESFTGKEALYLALLDRIVADVAARLDLVLAEAADEPDEAAVTGALIRAFADAFVRDVRVARVTFGEGRAVTPLAEAHRRANRRWAAGFVESVWRRLGTAADDGPGRAGTHVIAMGLIGGFFDIIADWLVDAEPAGADRAYVEDALARFYRVISKGLSTAS